MYAWCRRLLSDGFEHHAGIASAHLGGAFELSAGLLMVDTVGRGIRRDVPLTESQGFPHSLVRRHARESLAVLLAKKIDHLAHLDKYSARMWRDE